MRCCDEMLHGMRALKLLSWEGLFAGMLGQFRRHEFKYLSQRKYLDAWCVYFWAATPVLTCLATFTAVALAHPGHGRSLTPASVFTTVSLLNMLIFPMNAFPWVINGLMEALVSKKRLQARSDTLIPYPHPASPHLSPTPFHRHCSLHPPASARPQPWPADLPVCLLPLSSASWSTRTTSAGPRGIPRPPAATVAASGAV